MEDGYFKKYIWLQEIKYLFINNYYNEITIIKMIKNRFIRILLYDYIISYLYIFKMIMYLIPLSAKERLH